MKKLRLLKFTQINLLARTTTFYHWIHLWKYMLLAIPSAKKKKLFCHFGSIWKGLTFSWSIGAHRKKGAQTTADERIDKRIVSERLKRQQHYGSKQANEWVNCAEFKVQIGVFQWTNADNNYRLHLSSSVAKKKTNERKEALVSYVCCVWAAMSVPKMLEMKGDRTNDKYAMLCLWCTNYFYIHIVDSLATNSRLSKREGVCRREREKKSEMYIDI